MARFQRNSSPFALVLASLVAAGCGAQGEGSGGAMSATAGAGASTSGVTTASNGGSGGTPTTTSGGTNSSGSTGGSTANNSGTTTGTATSSTTTGASGSTGTTSTAASTSAGSTDSTGSATSTGSAASSGSNSGASAGSDAAATRDTGSNDGSTRGDGGGTGSTTGRTTSGTTGATTGAARDGGTSGAGDAAAAGDAASGFVCNQVTGLTLTREWFEAGFETGVDNTRWQLKAQEHGYIFEWANPNSTFWDVAIESPCASRSTSPDRVVLVVLSWTITAQTEWETDISAAITNFQTKYPGLRRIDLITVIRGPNNMLCSTAPAAGETIQMPASLDAAIAAQAAKNPGFVFAGPKFEASACGDFSGGGPHLTTAGNTKIAKVISSYFAMSQ